MNEDEMVRLVRFALGVIGEDDELDPTVNCASTYEDAGVMTMNKGLIVEMSDGSEFQMTIIQKQAATPAPCEDEEVAPWMVMMGS